MTDEELESVESDIRQNAYVQDELMALVAECKRLRSAKRIDEGELAAIRRALHQTQSPDEPVRKAKDDIRTLLAHIDLQDNVIHDLMSEGAAAKLVEQGRAEERAVIVEWLYSLAKGWMTEDGESIDAAMTSALAKDLKDGGYGIRPVEDLLPPAAARAEADRLRRENERLKEGLRYIAEQDPDGSAIAARLTLEGAAV